MPPWKASPVMAKVPFKQIDVRRAVKGAKAAGLAVAQVEIDPCTGRILIRAASASDSTEPSRNDLDRWLERHANSS